MAIDSLENLNSQWGEAPNPTEESVSAAPSAENPDARLHVQVEGLSFNYQFTEDDVGKVFGRYGGILKVSIGAGGSSASVDFKDKDAAAHAHGDLNEKPLAGIQGAYLKISPCQILINEGRIGAKPAATSTNNWSATATNNWNAKNNWSASANNNWGVANNWGGNNNWGSNQNSNRGGNNWGQNNWSQSNSQSNSWNQSGGQSPQTRVQNFGEKKFTCRIEIGIENEREFRVGSRVIQIARRIWGDSPGFSAAGGKTRLRGKGVGGPQESDEPIALCISCREDGPFQEAIKYAERELSRVHDEYRQFARDRQWPDPMLTDPKAMCDHSHTAVPGYEQRLVTYDNANGNGSGYGSYNSNDSQYAVGQGSTSAPVDRGMQPEGAPTEEEVENLIRERNEARKNNDFKKADDIRAHLKDCHVVLMDDNMGPRSATEWRYWKS